MYVCVHMYIYVCMYGMYVCMYIYIYYPYHFGSLRGLERILEGVGVVVEVSEEGEHNQCHPHRNAEGLSSVGDTPPFLAQPCYMLRAGVCTDHQSHGVARDSESAAENLVDVAPKKAPDSRTPHGMEVNHVTFVRLL